MPGPISSLCSNDPSNACVEDDRTASTPAAPLQSVAPEPAQSSSETSTLAETPLASQSLVQKFTPPIALPAVTPSAGTGLPSSTQWLATSSGAVPGGGSYRVAASVMKDEVTSGLFQGSSAEIGTASVEYGKDNDAQLVGARETLRLHRGGYSLSVTGEALTARGNLGEHGDDGSLGGALGAGAELVGAEATLDTPLGSITYGNSVSVSLSGSMGVRDADHDGKPEFCGKFSIPAYTVGACIEQFW
ncbi:MAG TPA: hypothetical protein VHM25_02955 [Polyangiaceae bacterium]|jgi:hypothetical protein|nr:hypothetical protein [Polyangiaceae bacterium]